jgi:hypothetical protein
MLGSLVVAQMEMVACEGLDGPIRHGAGCASALQSAVALRAFQSAVALSVRTVRASKARWRQIACDEVRAKARWRCAILRELSLTFLPGGVTYTVEG